jgi:hypothetical protein
MGFVLAALLTTVSAQERAELPRELDTWYTVIRDKEAVGYLHETLTQALKPGRYEYVLECELEIKPHVEEFTWKAQLDETLTPMECASDVHTNGFPSGLVMYTRDDERRLELRPFVGEPVLWTHPSREDVHLLPTLSLYALRQNDTLSKQGRITLRTADARSVEVVLEVGESIRREYLGKECRVTPVRFLKPFPAASRETEMTEAFVDRYGRIVEARLAGGARIVVVENNLEALAAVGAVRRRGRRDIFDKLTAMQNASRERELARWGVKDEPPVVTADSLRSDLEAARKMAGEIRELKAQGEPEAARKSYLKMLLLLKSVRRVAERARPELIPEIIEVREAAELAWDGAAQLRNAAGREFVKVTAQMENLEVEAMEKTHKTLLGFLDRIEVEGRPERQAIAEWASQVGTLVVNCRTRRALAQMRLDVSAITLWETVTNEKVGAPFWTVEVRFVRPHAEAEINGRIYRTGDTIQGTQVKVDRITAHTVQVSLRNEVRDVPLRR